MKKRMIWLSLLLIVFNWGCQNKNNESQVRQAAEEKPQMKERYEHLPAGLLAGLEAHGGVDSWKKYGTLSYDLTKRGGSEKLLTDLHTRKVLLTLADYQIGYDGQDVWISPNKAAMGGGSPRFYHNLNFYFFALPFVFADPGIRYEVLADREIGGKVYDAIKISFDDGVGDASGDYYIAHFDQETHQLYLLLYTVTYFSGESNENYNAIIYHEWQNAGGLLVPRVMKGYKYIDGEIGEQRYEARFDNVIFKEKTPDPSLFAVPENAEIDLPNAKD